MDLQSLANLLLTSALAALGYFYRQNDVKLAKLEQKQHDIALHMALEYVRKDDLSAAMARIETMFTKIFDKLDSKVDK